MKFIHYLNKAIEYSFYLLFFLVPLYFTNNTSELFELNKMWLTWWLTIVIVGAWLCKMIAQKRFFLQRTPLDIPILLFFFSQLLSTIFSLDMHLSIWGYYSRFNGGLLSTISYLLLYYAFVSNYHDIHNEQEQKVARFSFPKRLGFFAGGLVLFPVAISLSSPPAANPDATNIGLLLICMLIAFGCFMLSLPYSFLRRVLYISLISGLIVSLWGIPSHFGKDPTCLLFRGELNVNCWTEAFYPTVRTFSTLGQPAWLAAYVSVLIPIVASFLLLKKKKTSDQEHTPIRTITDLISLESVLFIGLLVVLYMSLLFANTKGGFIGFWVGNALFWAVLFLKRTLSLQTFLQAFLFFHVILLFLNFIFTTPVQQLNAFTFQSLTAKQLTSSEAAPSHEISTGQPAASALGGTDSGQIRLYVWQGALDIWKAYPLFGTGVETFAFAYYQFRPAEHNLTSEWDYLYNKAHNEYLNYLATTGALGLGSYLLFIGVFVFITLRYLLHPLVKKLTPFLAKKDPTSSPLASQLLSIGLVSGFVTILVSNFFGFSVVIVNLYLFLIPAVVFALLNLLPSDRQLLLPKNTHTSSISGGQWFGIVTIGIIGLYLSFMLYLFRQADISYALGNNLDNVQEYQQAFPHLQQAVLTRPGEPLFRDEFAVNNATLATLLLLQENASGSAEIQQQASQLAQQAIQLHEEVIREHPNNVVFWKNRVRIFYLLSQVDSQYLPYAVDSMKQVGVLAPTDAKVMYNLGVLYKNSGQLDEAEKALKKAIELKPNYRDPYFALALTLREKATNDAGVVTNQELNDEAITTLERILTTISSTDEEVKQLLESWNK